MPPRAIIIRSRRGAVSALKAAKAMDADVWLLGASGTAYSMGATLFQAIVAEARKEIPGARSLAVLDCGDAPGHALAAFRHGVEAVSIAAGESTRRRIEDIARQCGSRLVDAPALALDPESASDPEAACRRWLSRPVAKRAP